MAKWVEGAVAVILRSQGFVPLPRMWCTEEERSQIIAICQKHEERVTAVRRHVAEQRRKQEEMEKAWTMK